MATVERENIGNLTDKLVVSVTKEDYFPTFEKKLKEYGKTANIPGFRKGMVPAGMIKKMYGAGIYQDEVLRSVEKELYTWLSKEKPEIFAQPLPLVNDTVLDMTNPGTYNFDFEIGIKPPFEVAPFDKANITKYEIELNEADMAEEVSRLQLKGGNMTEPETITNEDDVLNVLFTETNENGEPIEGGIVKENSVMLKYFSLALQKQLMDKKAGEEINFKLKDSFDAEALKNILHDLGLEGNDEAENKNFNLKVDKIGHVEKRELEEGFFKEIFPAKDLKTEEEFKTALREDFEKHLEGQSKNQVHDQLYHYLLNETKMEFPEAFLKRWLQNGGDQQKTAEQVEQEFPTFLNQLKWQLISEKIMAEQKLEVGEQEIKEQMRTEIMGYFGGMDMGGDTSFIDSYIDRMLKDEKHVDATYRRLSTTKLFDYAEAQVKATPKKISEKEFKEMVENHHH